jgi:hypothetical protein
MPVFQALCLMMRHDLPSGRAEFPAFELQERASRAAFGLPGRQYFIEYNVDTAALGA